MFQWPTIPILLLTTLASIAASATQPQHDKDFWRAILKERRYGGHSIPRIV
jgi:hypothetical protein